MSGQILQAHDIGSTSDDRNGSAMNSHTGTAGRHVRSKMIAYDDREANDGIMMGIFIWGGAAAAFWTAILSVIWLVAF